MVACVGGYGGGNPPQQLKPSDIKVGDVIGVMGEIDATAKSVGATVIAQVDPERVQQMREMEANFGKTWLQGKVTAIKETNITLTGTIDNAPTHCCRRRKYHSSASAATP